MATLLETDFSSISNGSAWPSPWTNGINQGTIDVQNEKGRLTGNNNNQVLASFSGTNEANITYVYRRNGNGFRYPFILSQGTLSGFPSNGYFWEVHSGGSNVMVRVGGSTVANVAAGFTIPNDTDVNIRIHFKAQDFLRFRVWEVGDPEPSTWDFDRDASSDASQNLSALSYRQHTTTLLIDDIVVQDTLAPPAEPVEVILEDSMEASAESGTHAVFLPDATVELPGAMVASAEAVDPTKFGFVEDVSVSAGVAEASALQTSVSIDTSAAGAETTYITTADTYIEEAASSQNNGSGIYLIFGAATTTAQSRDALMKFNVSPSSVESARIRLYRHETFASPNYRVHSIDADWAEGTVTWNNRPAMGDVVGEVGQVPSSQAAGWREFDATDIVKAWADGKTNFGIAIRNNNSSAGHRAVNRSRDYDGTGNTTQSPRLIIQTASTQNTSISVAPMNASSVAVDPTVETVESIPAIIEPLPATASALSVGVVVDTVENVTVVTGIFQGDSLFVDPTLDIINPDNEHFAAVATASAEATDPTVTAAVSIAIEAEPATATATQTDADIQTSIKALPMFALATGPHLEYMESMDPFFNFVAETLAPPEAASQVRRGTWVRFDTPDTTSELFNRFTANSSDRNPIPHGGLLNNIKRDKENLIGRSYVSFNGVDQWIDMNAYLGNTSQLQIGVRQSTFGGTTLGRHEAFVAMIAFRTTNPNTAIAEDLRIENGRIVFSHPRHTDVMRNRFTGTTRVDDGKWHLLAVNYGRPARARRPDEPGTVGTASEPGRVATIVEVRIDNVLEMRRWVSSSQNFWHPRMNTIGRDGNDFFQGDIAEFVVRWNRDSGPLPPTDALPIIIGENDLKFYNYKWIGTNLRHAPVLGATAAAGPDTSGRGNVKRLLMLYYLENMSTSMQAGHIYRPPDSGVGDRHQSFLDLNEPETGRQTHHSGIHFPRNTTTLVGESAREDTFAWGPYIVERRHIFRSVDPVTWTTKFIDVENDIEHDRYDAVVLVNYPISRKNWSTDGRRLFDEFVESYKRAMINGMKTIIFDPYFAAHLGIVKRVDSTTYQHERLAGGHEAGRSFSVQPAIQDRVGGEPHAVYVNTPKPDGTFRRVPQVSMTDQEIINGDIRRLWDQDYLNRHRIVQGVPGLTDIETPEPHYDTIDHMDYQWGTSAINERFRAWKNVRRDVLAPGHELYVPDTPDWYTGGRNFGTNWMLRYRNKFFYGVAGEENIIGTPVTKGQDMYWHNGVHIPSPTRNWISSFVIEQGTEIDGQILQGRVFVTFNEAHSFNGNRIWAPPVRENRWPTGHSREDNSPFDFHTGRIEQRVVQLLVYMSDESDRQREVPQLQILGQPPVTTVGRHYSILYRGVEWLHEDDDLEPGAVKVHSQSMTATASANEGTMTADRNINITAHRPMRALGVLIPMDEAEIPDVEIHMWSMEASADFMEPPTTIQVAPMTAIAIGPITSIIWDIEPFERPAVPAYVFRPQATVFVRS